MRIASRLSWMLVVLCSAAPLRAADPPASPTSEIDTFMATVIAKRDENWRKLRQYVLDERERTILTLRFGLDGGGERTLEEVAEHFGLTRERIRQIEVRAMSKLRHPSADVGARELLEAV